MGTAKRGIRRRRRPAGALSAALLAVALLAGCASIPLSTALRLASMGPASLVEADPVGLRVKVSLPADFGLDVDRARLKMALQSDDGESRSAEMTLRLLQHVSETRRGGMFRADIPVSSYFLALSEQGVEQLRDIQRFARPGRRYEATVSVTTPFSRTPPDPEEVTFWVDLQLEPGEPYMPLIDRARMKFDKETSGNSS